jgi:hypothetical protein
MCRFIPIRILPGDSGLNLVNFVQADAFLQTRLCRLHKQTSARVLRNARRCQGETGFGDWIPGVSESRVVQSR